jgi:hypothetical protein
MLLFLDADVRIGPGFMGDATGEFLRRRPAVATCACDPDGGYLLRFHPPIVPDVRTTARELQEGIGCALERGISDNPAAWWVFFDFWDVEAEFAVSRAEGVA